MAILAAQVLFHERTATLLRLADVTLNHGSYLKLFLPLQLQALLTIAGITTHRQTKAALTALADFIQHVNQGMQELNTLRHDVMSPTEDSHAFSEKTLGSVAYFALPAHNLSRMALHPEVKAMLESCLNETKESAYATDVS